MRLKLFVAMTAMAVLISTAITTAAEGSSSEIRVLYGRFVDITDGSWVNDVLDINWPGMRTTAGDSVEILYSAPVPDEANMRYCIGVAIRDVNFKADTITFGDGGTFGRDGKMRWYSLVGELEFMAKKKIRPFIGLTGSLLYIRRNYEKKWLDQGQPLRDWQSESDLGAGLEGRAGINVYPLRHIQLKAYLDYFDFATLPAIRIGGGFVF